MASPLATALMMQQPMAGVPTGTVAPTDVVGAYNNYNNAKVQEYAAKVAQQNAMFGGLAGLGGAGILAAPKLLGAGGPFAAGGMFSPYATTADAGLGGIGTGGFNAIDAAGSAAPALADAGAAGADLTAAAAPSVADALASAAPVAADAAASTLPDWLASAAMFLPFLG